MATGKVQPWLTAEGLEKIYTLSKSKFSDLQIAKQMGISKTSLYDWMKRYPAISDAIKKGREPVKLDVRDALYAGCTIQYYDEKKVERIIKDGVEVERRETTTTKAIPPSSALIIFALKNLFPDEFKDKPLGETDNEQQIAKAREILGNVHSAIDNKEGG